MSENWPNHFPRSVLQDAKGRAGVQSALIIILEAWRRGLTVSVLDSALSRVEVSDGNHVVVFNHSCPLTLTTAHARRVCRNKQDTKHVLENAGVPTPVGEILQTLNLSIEQLIAAGDRVGYPCVLKPAAGSRGDGVHTNIKGADQLKNAYSDLIETLEPSEILIERHQRGKDYRILVLGDQVIAACLREPAYIIGDGKSTVESLISAKNELRKQNPFLATGLIKVDFEVIDRLTEQNLTLSTIPRAGARVHLRRVANASAGGEVLDATDEVPNEVKKAAVGAVAAIDGLHLAGVDILIDTDAPQSMPSYSVIEINYRPHIGVNMFPSVGVGQDVPFHMLNYFFPGSPRPNSPNIDRTALNLRALTAPLRLGMAQRVTLAPVPSEGFEASQIFRLPPMKISNLDRAKIIKESRKQNISGTLNIKPTETVLIASGRLADIQTFYGLISSLVKQKATSSKKWRGRISIGFNITELN